MASPVANQNDESFYCAQILLRNIRGDPCQLEKCPCNIWKVLPAKTDVVSHPVRAWKMGRHFDLDGPRAFAKGCTSRILWLIPLGLKSQQLTLPRQCLLIESWLTGIWTIILVSTCSCEQGDNLFFLVAGGEQSTSSPRVTMICLPSIPVLTTCSDRNKNSSFLSLSKRKNSCQFRSTIADGRTVPYGASACLQPCAGFQTVRDIFISHQIQPLYIFNWLFDLGQKDLPRCIPWTELWQNARPIQQPMSVSLMCPPIYPRTVLSHIWYLT